MEVLRSGYSYDGKTAMLNTANWKTSTLNVTSISLDKNNIRLENASPSQDAVIQDLFTNYKAFDLAKSILQFGLFNHELPIVVKENKKYIVLEGNRRIAALKAIINPKLVPKYEKTIRALVKEAGDISTLQKVEVKIADSRDSTSRVIATIHTVQSRIPWKPLRQAYFYFAQIESGKQTLAQLKAAYPEVDIPRFVKMWEMHRVAKSIKYDSAETQAKVASSSFPITTFERVYSNEAFKKKAGLSFDNNGRVSVSSDKSEFEGLIKRLVTDIADKNIDSRLLNKMDSKAAHDYLNSLGKPKRAKKKISADDFIPIPETGQRRTKLIVTELECTLGYPAINKMLKELRSIPFGKYPNATHDLLRSFLEKSMKAYLQSMGMTPRPNLDGVITQGITYFETIKRRDLKQILQKIQGQGPYLYSKDNLDALNHNHHIFSIGEDVVNAWDQMRPVLEYVLNPPNKKNKKSDSNKKS